MDPPAAAPVSHFGSSGRLTRTGERAVAWRRRPARGVGRAASPDASFARSHDRPRNSLIPRTPFHASTALAFRPIWPMFPLPQSRGGSLTVHEAPWSYLPLFVPVPVLVTSDLVLGTFFRGCSGFDPWLECAAAGRERRTLANPPSKKQTATLKKCLWRPKCRLVPTVTPASG